MLDQYRYKNILFLSNTLQYIIPTRQNPECKVSYNDEILYVHQNLANYISYYFDNTRNYVIKYYNKTNMLKVIFDFYYFYNDISMDNFIKHIRNYKNDELVGELYLFCKKYEFSEMTIIIDKYIEQYANSLEKYYFCKIHLLNNNYKKICDLLLNILQYIYDKEIIAIFNEQDINQISNYIYDDIFINILRKTQKMSYDINKNVCYLKKSNSNIDILIFDSEYIKNNCIEVNNSNWEKEYNVKIGDTNINFKYEYYHDYHKGTQYYEFIISSFNYKKILYNDKNIMNETLDYYPINKKYGLEYYYFIMEK
jgi:hypothetical protein